MMSWASAAASAVRTEPLWQALGVRPGVTAIIGSGGKTSLMLHLCRELPGSVIVCTSTHIWPPETLPVCTEALDGLPRPKLCVGTPCADGKLTAPPDSFERLAALADEAMLSSVIRVLYVQALPAGGHPLRGRAQNIE